MAKNKKLPKITMLREALHPKYAEVLKSTAINLGHTGPQTTDAYYQTLELNAREAETEGTDGEQNIIDEFNHCR